ncbi:Uncharacterised protein [Burkholderia pseudomallei]|nr:Uncharacterised protein [Burkholderia pseudomallei]
MFDITPDDIKELNDVDLRILVGRLCEAELSRRGFSPSAVTYGGSQTAADGGLDVRVELPANADIDGFIPRRITGFQVKTPDMARAAIIDEMRPHGAIRPVIQDLASNAGAYIIACSTGTVADMRLRERREAMRESLDEVPNSDQLHTDFYDRTRLATWVRCFPGLVAWVKQRIGRSLRGWRPYGAWSGAAEGVDASYLVDEGLRLHLGRADESPRSIGDGLEQLRSALAQPGKIVRLVGLSGVGKTRLVQALFDHRVGNGALPTSLAVYTDMSDDPDPQPVGLASNLIASGTRAILIVDNCPPELHRRLAEVCSDQSSRLSLLTVEYDVRDDQPEMTQVVTLDVSSPELLEVLVRRRYQHISPVDAHLIAEAAGGNARIALALAQTVARTETISGLSDEQLFERLFRQRHDPSNALVLSAQAVSLVYSFEGTALEGEAAELPRLAALVGQASLEILRHVAELHRRGLIQSRGAWRALLPHAIANRLAMRALEEIPFELIERQLISGGAERLAKSFSRRLSYLHRSPQATSIVERWLAPSGYLGNVAAFDDLRLAMFENIAPVCPEAALAALERCRTQDQENAIAVWQRHARLLRSLAYEPALFTKCTALLAEVATQSRHQVDADGAATIFTSLFTVCLSGTLATVDQRVDVIERLLISDDPKRRALGFAALNEALKTDLFSSSYSFDFGARSRDYGYAPRSRDEVARWYETVISLIERVAASHMALRPELLAVLARHLRGLWRAAGVPDRLESLFRERASNGFWRDGWVACRQALHYDSAALPPELVARLSALEVSLRPVDLADQVRAVALGRTSNGLNLEEIEVDKDVARSLERLEAQAFHLGEATARDRAVLIGLMPELVAGGNKAWAFGRGLASGTGNAVDVFNLFVDALAQQDPRQRNVQVLRGFLSELWERDRETAQRLFDRALTEPILAAQFPELQASVLLDERAVERLVRAIGSGTAPLWQYRYLTFGRVTDSLDGNRFGHLVLSLADRMAEEGVDVALEILAMRLFADRKDNRTHEPALIDAGIRLLQLLRFGNDDSEKDYHRSQVAEACLAAVDCATVAGLVVTRLIEAVVAHRTSLTENTQLLGALLKAQPVAVLDVLFASDSEERVESLAALGQVHGDRASPADAVSCEVLIEWCDRDPDRRYPFVASLIRFAVRPSPGAPLQWSAQPIALLSSAPDPQAVLVRFAERFVPRSWSGSRAAVMEENGHLLDQLRIAGRTDLASVIDATKEQFAQRVARERRAETDRDRTRDETFE